ncbi:MAG TPA: DUF268 domain-containing protein [Acidiferrobacterales bacterium]|nr:DUF268 domain-containing protein [Acidiferrobacterales bacterium]
MNSVRKMLNSYAGIRIGYQFFAALKQQYYFNIFKAVWNFLRFVKEYRGYLLQASNPNFDVAARYFYPCLTDRTIKTPIEPTYFFQDTWAARKIFQIRPQHHYDVGSSARTMGIISQYVPTTMVDIRPVDLNVNNFHFKQGSIIALPFEDNTIESLSSLCVVEHIGLGRYGDPIDSWGSEKAISELKRVLRARGHLLVSVPVDRECRVYFNAHRAFTREYILQLFFDMDLIEEKYIYGRKFQINYDSLKGFGTGLFHFIKPN